MSEFKKGDFVVYKDTYNDEVIFPDGLFVVTRKSRDGGYLEVLETNCWHHNKQRWGSYGGDDLRHATPEEIKAGRRLP